MLLCMIYECADHHEMFMYQSRALISYLCILTALPFGRIILEAIVFYGLINQEHTERSD